MMLLAQRVDQIHSLCEVLQSFGVGIYALAIVSHHLTQILKLCHHRMKA